MRAPQLIVVLLAVGVMLVTPAVSASPQAQESLHSLAGEIELARLIDLAAETRALAIVYDARTLAGSPVTLRVRRELDDQELWSLLNAVLASRGFAIVQLPGSDVLTVVRVQDAQSLTTIDDSARPETEGGYVTVITELVYREAKEVIDAVRPLVSKPGGAIAQLGATNLLLVSDFRPRLDQLLRLIERVDVPFDPPVVRSVPAQNLSANKLADLVNAASAALGSVAPRPLRGKLIPAPDEDAIVIVATEDELPAWLGLIEQFDRRQAVQTHTYAPMYFPLADVSQLLEQVARETGPRGSGEQWRLVADDLTGTLVVTATPSEHERVEALMERLNAVPTAARRPVRAFPIRNRSVGDILDVITQLIHAGVLEATKSGVRAGEEARRVPQRTQREVLPPGVAPLRPREEGPRGTAAGETPRALPAARRGRSAEQEPPITLTADEGTNTLIAVGDARRLEQLETLIRTLDVRQPQVMVEVLLVNLTESDQIDLGVELEKMEISGSTLFNLSSLFGLGIPGLAGGGEAPAGRGFSGLVLNPGDFRILIRALQSLNEGRTLNVPRVLVSNNQNALFDSVLQQPFSSINASNTIATTSFGGTQDAGTSITVTPQIAEGDHLVLEYSVALSSFVGESSDPALPPPRQQTSLESVVTIPDGYTIVVGGFESVTEAEAVSKVPLLGDIPIVGELFKSRSSSTSRSRFFVFIRANILRHEGFEDLKYISDRDLVAAEVEDGWPEVEPRIIR